MAELAAKTQAAQLRLLADNVPAAIAYYKAEGFKCIFANRQYTRMFGQTEESIVGMTFAQIIGEEATRLIQPMVDKLLNEGIAANYVRALNSPDGQPVRWLEVSLIPQFGELGQVIAAFVLISDITKHRLAEQAVRDSEQRLMAFMNASAEGIVIHQNGRIIDVNPALCELINLRHDELVGRDGMSFVPLEYRAEIVANVSAQRNARYESMVMDREGVHIPVEFIGRTVDYRGTPARMSIVRDLRDRKAAQERINYLAHHDDMTGLYNRTQFLSLLDTALEGRRARSKHAALLFIDLDNFKRVNDTHGHRAGDELLKEIAKRLKRVFRESDIVARYAGDEFIVLLQEVQSLPEVSGMAQRLIEVVSEPFSYDTHQLEVSASVGIAVFPDDASVAEDLIAHADTAAYNAKHGGGAQYAFYSHIDIDSWHI
jgi:diguanylate cyclase (GGDEF)-like protein/PAS domain S-box-containing protein